ncbi:MAG TPA: BMP family protein [Nitrososphaeraceae archaeon]|nr:BMP family protein [Nitrososphaeraceae archaeon]
MMFTKITMYGFAMIFGFGIAFIIIGFSDLSFYPYAFSTKDINETTTTAQLTSNLNNSTIQDSKIIFVTDGLFSDAGWGAFGYNAARAIENKYGYHIDFKENVAIPDIESTLIEYAKDGYELIIAHGYEWGKPAIKVGKNYPDTKFIVFTGLVNATNVVSIFPMQHEGAYLLGALAAMMSKTGIIGFVGGEKYPNLINIFEGYKQGAKDINPNAKVLATYLDEWDSPAKGKEAALSHINSGADFLLQVADTSGSGVIEAAKEKKIFAFGSVSDQYKLAPNTVLTSFVLDEEKAFDQAIKMIQNSNFTGKIFKPGLEPYKEAPGDGIIYIAPFYGLENKVPEDVKTKFNTLKEDVINKKIVIPERYEITKVD